MSQTKPLQPWRNRPNPFQGTPGPQGPPGEDGSQWHSVTSTPTGSLGVVGDWALNTSTGATWQKTGTATWTSRGSLRGPQGVQGPQGPQGATGATGADGATWLSGTSNPTGSIGEVGDWYLTTGSGTNAGQVWEKTGASTWTPRVSLKGPQGVKGDSGATGPTGPAGTITGATATGLAAGASPTVTLGGTSSARTFAFGIPKGDKGEKGDTGATGAKGDPGDTGPAGTAATLSVGSTSTGAPGTDASVTQSGTPQARTFNFTIPRGDKGDTGDTGPKGDPGGAGILGGAKAHLSTAQSIPHGQWTALLRNSADYIVSGTVAWSFSPSRLQCYVQQGGWWMVGFGMSWAGNSSGRRQTVVETWTGTDPGVNNGTPIIRHDLLGLANDAFGYTGSTVVHLDANTNVRLIAWQNSGSSLDANPSGLARPTELWLTRIL